MVKTHSRSKSRSRSRSFGKSKKEKVDVDFSKNIYYVDGSGKVIEKNRSTGHKKTLVKIPREYGYLYYVTGKGEIGRSPMKHV